MHAVHDTAPIRGRISIGTINACLQRHSERPYRQVSQHGPWLYAESLHRHLLLRANTTVRDT